MTKPPTDTLSDLLHSLDFSAHARTRRGDIRKLHAWLTDLDRGWADRNNALRLGALQRPASARRSPQALLDFVQAQVETSVEKLFNEANERGPIRYDGEGIEMVRKVAQPLMQQAWDNMTPEQRQGIQAWAEGQPLPDFVAPPSGAGAMCQATPAEKATILADLQAKTQARQARCQANPDGPEARDVAAFADALKDSPYQLSTERIDPAELEQVGTPKGVWETYRNGKRMGLWSFTCAACNGVVNPGSGHHACIRVAPYPYDPAKFNWRRDIWRAKANPEQHRARTHRTGLVRCKDCNALLVNKPDAIARHKRACGSTPRARCG